MKNTFPYHQAVCSIRVNQALITSFCKQYKHVHVYHLQANSNITMVHPSYCSVHIVFYSESADTGRHRDMDLFKVQKH